MKFVIEVDLKHTYTYLVKQCKSTIITVGFLEDSEVTPDKFSIHRIYTYIMRS
jgi:hypothetical protein